VYKLALSVDGLLKQHIYNDASHAFSTGDWDLGGETVALDGSGRLQFPYGSGVARFGRLTTVADQSEMCVATLSRVVSFGGTTWLGAGALCSGSQTGLLGRQSRISAPLSIDEDDSGTLSNVNTGSSYAFAAGSFHWMILHADASVLTFRNHSTPEIVTGSQIAGSRSGKPGIWRQTTTSGNLILTEQFYAMKGRYAIFSGLAQNMVVALYGSTGTLIESQTADASGIAAFDMLGANLVFANARWVVVYDTDGTTPRAIKEYATTGANRRGIIGGDSWVLSSATSQAATITNPGAELGNNNGWTSGGGSFVPAFSSVSKRTGTYSWRLHSTLTQTNYRYQDVSVPAQAESKIDAGDGVVQSLYWQNGLAGQNDGGWIDLEFYSGAMSLLGASAYTVNRQLTGSGTTYRPRGETVAVPVGTRTVRLYLRGNQNTGTDPDAYIDDIELHLTVGGPTTPTVALDPDSFFVDAVGSLYASDESLDHKATQWQISTDAGFVTIVEDTTDTYDPGSPQSPPTHTFVDLNASTNYWARVRYQDTDDQWSGWGTASTTTDAGNAPNTPSIVTATPTVDQVTLEGSAFSDTEMPARALVMAEWQIDESGGDFSTPVVESLLDLVNLLAITLGGLTASTDYIARYRQRADDGSWSAWSSSKAFTTTAAPASPPATPTASLSSKTSHSVTLAGSAFSYPGTGETHAETLVEVSTSSSFPFASTFQESFTPGQTSGLLVDGLSPNTLYYYRIRYRATDDVWSAWSATQSTTTLTDVLAGAFLVASSPRHGAVVSGSYPIAFSPVLGGVDYELELSANYVDWTPIATVSTSPYSWDTTSVPDGTYVLRIRATDGSSPTRWEYRIVFVDNAGDPLLFNVNADDGQPSSEFAARWNTTGHAWTLNETSVLNTGSKLASTGYAGLAWSGAYEPRDADIVVEVLNASTGGSFPWSWFPEQCFAGAGLVGSGSGSDIVDGIVATFYSIPINAIGDCFTGGRGDGFLVVEAFEAGIRVKSSTVNLGKIHFVKLFGGCSKVPRYGVRLRVDTLEELPNDRRRVRIRATVQGMEIDTDAAGEWHYDGTLETSLQCGEPMYATKEITTSNAYRSFTSMTVRALDFGSCLAPPATSPPGGEGGIGTAAKPCTLILQVYEEDRATIAWEVGTDPDHPNPFLALPENYDEQEIDVVNGAATIGQVEAIVVDPNQIVGDQYSGWMTERLSEGSITAVHGRRCRLIRYISPELGWIVLADGPAGPPRMDESYAAYRWTIRDTRETERAIRAFVSADVWVLPLGIESGWGYDAGEWLVPPADPLTGSVCRDAYSVSVTLDDYWSSSFGCPPGAISPSSPDLLDDAVVIQSLEMFLPVWDDVAGVQRYPDVRVMWRPSGGGPDDWVEFDPRYTDNEGLVGDRLVLGREDAVTPGGVTVTAAYRLVLWNFFTSGVPSLQENLETAPSLPANGQEVEVAVRWVGAPSAERPVFLEYDEDGVTRLTTGKLLRNLYDGVYSARDPDTGAVVPSDVLYDPAALAQMTDPVRAVITELVEDGRDWSERVVYSPTGWIPALDRDLRISPVSQVPPETTAGLTDVTNLVTNPLPDWNAGERIINVVGFTYDRYYVDALRAPDAIGHLRSREITHIYEDAASVRTHKEQRVTFDGVLFAALGDENGATRGLASEYGFALAQLRKLYVLDRFKDGAQAIQVPVFRSVTALNRPGDWVVVDLSWFPDYLLRRRGMLTMMQVIAIRDLDCAWRLLLLEEAFPPTLGS